MATSQNGLFGIITGKVGNLVGYSYNGVQCFRSAPKKSNKPPTLAQQAQRMRFALVIGFLNPLKSITSKGYGNRQSKKSQSAQCVGYHTTQATTGTFPHIEIDFNKVMLTTGRLSGVLNGEISSNLPEFIDFSWTEHMQCRCNGADQAILIAYCPATQGHEFRRTTSIRTDRRATLEVPMGFSGNSVHCWIIFISPDGNEFSTSSYLGSVIVASLTKITNP